VQASGRFFASGLTVENDLHVPTSWHDMCEHTQVAGSYFPFITLIHLASCHSKVSEIRRYVLKICYFV